MILTKPTLKPPLYARLAERPKKVNVFCVFVGEKYAIDYVYRLAAMVERNLTVPHEFYCLSDRSCLSGIETIQTQNNWPGWWQKVNLFNTQRMPHGLTLYLDLDVVIVANIDDLVSVVTNCGITMIQNYGQNRSHAAHNSSVMLWQSGDARPAAIYEQFVTRVDYVQQNLHGDQCWIWRVMRDDIADFPEDWIRSYKYHCTSGLKGTEKVVVFHGKPDPHEVHDGWVVDHWR